MLALDIMNIPHYARSMERIYTPHRCATINESKRNQPSDRDQQARCKVQEKASDFHTNFYDPVYLSIGPEAKRDI